MLYLYINVYNVNDPESGKTLITTINKQLIFKCGEPQGPQGSVLGTTLFLVDTHIYTVSRVRVNLGQTIFFASANAVFAADTYYFDFLYLIFLIKYLILTKNHFVLLLLRAEFKLPVVF